MKNMKTFAALAAAGMAVAAFAGDELTAAQEAVAKAGPKNMKVMIAGFGTIESMTKAEKWLGETIPEQQNLSKPPTLSEADKVANPDLSKDIVRLNWVTRKIEYIHERQAVESENERNRRLLNNLRMKVLTDPSQRYVPLAKEYLQAALSRKAGTMIQVVDRSSADMAMVEQALNGDNSSALSGATCILTATVGDREEDSRTVPVNGKGTKVKTTTFTQPYTFKVRDLHGNVLMAESGTATCTSTVNNIVKSEVSDPARKLIESVTTEIADKLLSFFTTRLKFKIKVPDGCDEDDVEVAVDGRGVDADDGVRVLAVEHAVVATLDGCAPIRKVIGVSETDGSKTVKLNFKKAAAKAEEAE